MQKRDDESAVDFLRRVVNWLNHEQESLLSDLPTVQAVLDYAELWSIYRTDFMTGILEAISEGDDPSPLLDFIAKYNLNWTIPTVGFCSE